VPGVGVGFGVAVGLGVGECQGIGVGVGLTVATNAAGPAVSLAVSAGNGVTAIKRSVIVRSITGEIVQAESNIAVALATDRRFMLRPFVVFWTNNDPTLTVNGRPSLATIAQGRNCRIVKIVSGCVW